MAHTAQFEYVRLLSESLGEHFRNRRVLEVGSLDIAGSVRGFFHECAYVGLDIAEGKGVDVVCEGQNYNAEDSSFDVVISCEVMEHNPHWAETFRNMIRLCRPGGLVVMTCATTGRPEHGTAQTDPYSSPLTVGLGWNYYRNLTSKDFERVIDMHASFSEHRFWVNWSHYDLLFAGIKGSAVMDSEATARWKAATNAIDDWVSIENGSRVRRYRELMASVFGDWWFTLMNRLLASMAWLHRPR